MHDAINEALECCLPLFVRCKPFLSIDVGVNVALDFRDVIIADFIAMEREAFAYQLPPPQVLQIKYAMAAFIDELVLNSQWPHRLSWMGRSLQLQFFGEHLAGEGFFERLSHIRQSGQSHLDTLEVYYWCLQLGFQGMYRLRGQEHLLALQVGCRSQIIAARGNIESRLAPLGLPPAAILKQPRHDIPFWIILVMTLTFIVGIYIAYSFAIDHQVNQVLHQIHQTSRLVVPGNYDE
jgi:type VI secretion system protein ImpK